MANVRVKPTPKVRVKPTPKARARFPKARRYPAYVQTVSATQAPRRLAHARVTAPRRTGSLAAGLYQRTAQDTANTAWSRAAIAVKRANPHAKIAPPVPLPPQGKTRLSGAAQHTLFIGKGTYKIRPRRIF